MAPPGRTYGGFGSNYVFITEYSLALLVLPRYKRLYCYSPYSNQWTLLPNNPSDTDFPPEEGFQCQAYDLKHRKAVVVYGNSSSYNGTWTYDMGTQSWTKITVNTEPTNGVTGWYNSYSAATYDRKNGVVIYLTADGSETWALDLDNNSWTNMNPTGSPSSCGNMGEGLTYDPKRNVTLVYANKNDEVWTYKYENGIQNRPDPVENPSGVTDASSITLSWGPPSAGVSPVKYYMYRAEWKDNAAKASGIIPGPYQLIDSTTQTTYTDANTAVITAAGVFHSYYISAVSAQGIESDPSSPVFTRLRVPMGLVATPYSKNRILLRWKPKYEADLAGYNIYRRQKAYPFTTEMKENRINNTLITGTPYFIDSTVSLCGSASCPDSMAMYVVTAVNRLGRESGLSPYTLTAPDWVTNMWTDTVNKVITWSPPRCGNIVNYRVCEGHQGSWEDSTDKSVYPVEVDVVTDTFWSYAGRTPSAYKVKAFNTINQLGYFSDVMAVETKDNDKFGMLRLDFQTHRPTVDTFYNDVPPISIGIEKRDVNEVLETGLEVYPSPFNSKTFIYVHRGQRSEVRSQNAEIIILNISGKVVYRLTSYLWHLASGFYWNASNHASGVYIIRVNVNEKVMEKRVILIR
jgi:hypothetical protein